jgi:ABC-2 type transport system permease protein
MRGFTTLIYSEIRLFLREPAAVFFTLAFPLMLMFIFGSIFGNDPDPQFGGWGNMDVSVQGYFALIIGTTTLIGLPVTIASYREQGVLRRLRATPLHPAAVILANIIVGGLASAAGTLLLVVAGKIFFDLRLPEQPFSLVLAWLLAFGSFSTFGFILGGVFPTARTAQAVGSALYFPQMFLSGAAGIPRDLFSTTLRRVTEPLPMTQIVNLVGGLWRGDGWSIVATFTLLGIGVASTLVAIKVFRWE